MNNATLAAVASDLGLQQYVVTGQKQVGPSGEDSWTVVECCIPFIALCDNCVVFYKGRVLHSQYNIVVFVLIRAWRAISSDSVFWQFWCEL